MSEIVIEGPEPIHIDPAKKVANRDLSRGEAEVLTGEIKKTTARLWLLVVEAHDRKAHIAMGYPTWDDYVRSELKMSPSRSYQLIDTGHVVREMAAGGADVESLTPPTARIVARVKNRLPDVRKAAKEAVRKGESIDSAIRILAREPIVVASSAAASSANSAEPVDSKDVASTSGATSGSNVTCPACHGTGKVTRSMAPKFRAWMRRQRSPEKA